MSVQNQLVSFAFEKAYPYMKEQPKIKEYLSQISFILVGSAATGLCNSDSDVDICLLCNQKIYDEISKDTRWNNGCPTEVILDGTQLHYYAISVESLHKKIDEMDALALYVYSNAMVIDDSNGQYQQIAERIHAPEVLFQRFQNESDMLRRRRGALHYVLNNDTDPMVRMEICTEIIKRLLICIALFDGNECDSRKRTYQTALLGNAGKSLKSKIDEMFLLIGKVCKKENEIEVTEFLRLFDDCFEYML